MFKINEYSLLHMGIYEFSTNIKRTCYMKSFRLSTSKTDTTLLAVTVMMLGKISFRLHAGYYPMLSAPLNISTFIKQNHQIINTNRYDNKSKVYACICVIRPAVKRHILGKIITLR